MRRRYLVVSLITAQGCFATSPPFVVPDAADAAALEERARTDFADLRPLSSLVLLHMREGRPDQARELLAPAVEALPTDPALPFLLGIVEEAAGRPAVARDQYGAYRRMHAGRLAQRAEQQLVVVDAAAARMDARRSLERPLDSSAVDPELVAVLPLAGGSTDEQTYAEGAGIAQLIEWDVGEEWNVVRGVHVRALLDELGVAAPDLADLSLGIEVGRRLGAARVVQGTIRQPSAGTAEWELTVLSLEAGSAIRVDHLAMTGRVDDVPPMLQRAGAMVLESLEEEPQLFLRAPVYTVSARAATELGRGLLALGRNEPAAAREAFLEAVRLDPNFLRAQELVRRMDTVLAAPGLDALAEEVVRLGELQRAVEGLRVAPSALHQTTLTRLGRSDRAAVSEILGLDVAGGQALLGVTFVVPGS